MDCHREPSPGLGKSLAGCPDQFECRWLAIRCEVEQKSYMHGGGKLKLTTSHAFRGSELNLHNAGKKANSAFDGR